MEKRLIDLKTASEYLSVSIHFLYKKVENKQLECVRRGRKILFDIRKLDELIEQCTGEAVDWSEYFERRV